MKTLIITMTIFTIAAFTAGKINENRWNNSFRFRGLNSEINLYHQDINCNRLQDFSYNNTTSDLSKFKMFAIFSMKSVMFYDPIALEFIKKIEENLVIENLNQQSVIEQNIEPKKVIVENKKRIINSDEPKKMAMEITKNSTDIYSDQTNQVFEQEIIND